MKKNCTTCIRRHDSRQCLECQASGDDYTMWRGEETDPLIELIELFREKTDVAPEPNPNHRATVRRMLDKIEQVYNAQKKPA